MISFKYIFVIILLCITSTSYAQEKSKYSILNNKELSKQVIAEIGSLQITVEEFINNYEFGPAFVKKMRDSKKRHLDFMIYEKLLALEGYKKRLDTLNDVQLILKDIHGDLAGEKLYRSLIWNNIEVSEQEISQAVEKENTSLILKWIFSRDADQASEIYQQLVKGTPFDDYFTRQFNDSVLFEDRFLETTRFKLERTNPVLASIIDSVIQGKISPPVKTNDGFYIIKLDNMRKDVIQTESGYNDQRYKIESTLRKQKADSASDAFVKLLFDKEQPVIVRKSFNALAYYLGKKFLNPDQLQDWDLAVHLYQKVLKDSNLTISAAFNDTLIKMNSGHVIMNTFLDWYSNRESYVKLSLTSKEGFLNSVQDIIWRMLRDNMITGVAKEQQFYNDSDVQQELKWWKDKVVYSKIKQLFASSILVTEHELQAYYNEHMSNYKDVSGEIKKFEEVREDIRNDYYVYTYTKKIINKVLALKSTYKININEELLNFISVSEENNPHSIELYSLKKGGTFVRPVYPVIDHEWQFWN